MEGWYVWNSAYLVWCPLTNRFSLSLTSLLSEIRFSVNAHMMQFRLFMACFLVYAQALNLTWMLPGMPTKQCMDMK